MFALGLGCVAVAPGRAQTRAPSATLPLSQYRALVAACRRAAASKLSPDSAGSWGRRLEAARTVTYPDGQRVTVDNRELAQTLRQTAANNPSARQKARAAALARLQTLDTLLTQPGKNAAARADDLRQQVAAILAGEEFRRAARTTQREKSWWERQWDRLVQAIKRFLAQLFGRGPRFPTQPGALGRGLVFLLYVVALAAALVALWALAKAWRERQTRAQRRARAGDLALADGEWADPLASARLSADAGNYRAALRLTYLACLKRLSASGLLVLEEDKTNWEYQRALQRRSRQAHETLLPVTRDFDRIWYGHRPATREEYERAVAVHDRLAPENSEPASLTTPTETQPVPRPSPQENNPW